MAEFSLNIKTESTQELLDIVSRINGAQTKPYNPAVTAELLETARSASDKVATAAIPEHHNVGSKVPTELPDVTPDRDAHGIKYDERIHPGRDSASLFKGDNTWRKRRGVADEQYEEIYLELAREARAAGLYTGPAIPELELESRVGPFYWSHPESSSFGEVPTLALLEEMLNADACAVEISEEQYRKLQEQDRKIGEALPIPEGEPVAPNPNAGLPTEVPAPAVPTPAPAAPAAPAPGMSAEDTPTPVKAVQALVAAAGPMAAHSLFKAFGVTAAPDCTPQQLRDMVAIAEKLAATLPPAEKMTRGQEALAAVALEFGYIVA